MIDGQEVVIENVPQSGRNDLYVLQYTPSDDLEVLPEGITLSIPNPRPGDTGTISASVKNRGDFSLDEVKVGFYDQDPYHGGTLISIQIIPVTLNAGESVTVSTDWKVPMEAGSHEIYVMADPEEEITEKNETNNLASILTVLPDLLVLGWESTPRGSLQDIVFKIRNEGSTPVVNVPLEYHLGSPEGELIATQTIAYLGGDTTVEQIYSLDTTGVTWTDGQVYVYAVVDPADNIIEHDEENNTRGIRITKKEELTLIELDRLSASSQANRIIITWNTASELNNAGFNLWRSEQENGTYIKINPVIIKAAGGATLSADYSYTDDTATPGVTYYYKLEDIDSKGLSTFHKPIAAAIPASLPASARASVPVPKPSYVPYWLKWYPPWSPTYEMNHHFLWPYYPYPYAATD